MSQYYSTGDNGDVEQSLLGPKGKKVNIVSDAGMHTVAAHELAHGKDSELLGHGSVAALNMLSLAGAGAMITYALVTKPDFSYEISSSYQDYATGNAVTEQWFRVPMKYAATAFFSVLGLQNLMQLAMVFMTKKMPALAFLNEGAGVMHFLQHLALVWVMMLVVGITEYFLYAAFALSVLAASIDTLISSRHGEGNGVKASVSTVSKMQPLVYGLLIATILTYAIWGTVKETGYIERVWGPIGAFLVYGMFVAFVSMQGVAFGSGAGVTRWLPRFLKLATFYTVMTSSSAKARFELKVEEDKIKPHPFWQMMVTNNAHAYVFQYNAFYAAMATAVGGTWIAGTIMKHSDHALGQALFWVFAFVPFTFICLSMMYTGYKHKPKA